MKSKSKHTLKLLTNNIINITLSHKNIISYLSEKKCTKCLSPINSNSVHINNTHYSPSYIKDFQTQLYIKNINLYFSLLDQNLIGDFFKMERFSEGLDSKNSFILNEYLSSNNITAISSYTIKNKIDKNEVLNLFKASIDCKCGNRCLSLMFYNENTPEVFNRKFK